MRLLCGISRFCRDSVMV